MECRPSTLKLGHICQVERLRGRLLGWFRRWEQTTTFLHRGLHEFRGGDRLARGPSHHDRRGDCLDWRAEQ